MSARKSHCMKSRMDRAMRGLLRQHKACIVDASLPEIQVVMHYKNGRQIISQQVSDALTNVAHRWTVNVIALCVAQGGERYLKRTEFVTASMYMADHLGDEIENQYRELADICNPAHLIGNAWIAIPDSVALGGDQVEMILESVRAWTETDYQHREVA